MTKEAIEKAVEAANGTPVEAKLVEMLDALQNGAVAVGDQIVKYSPEVADAALMVVRVDGVQQVLYGVAAIPFLLFFVKKARRLVAWASDNSKKHGDDIYYFPAFLGGLFLIIPGFAAFGYAERLLNVWTWVAIFEPKLYLAKQIISAALGK